MWQAFEPSMDMTKGIDMCEDEACTCVPESTSEKMLGSKAGQAFNGEGNNNICNLANECTDSEVRHPTGAENKNDTDESALSDLKRDNNQAALEPIVISDHGWRPMYCRRGSMCFFSYWGFEAHDVVPDIVTMAKGIGNGIPLGAVVTTPNIAEVLTLGASWYGIPLGSEGGMLGVGCCSLRDGPFCCAWARFVCSFILFGIIYVNLYLIVTDRFSFIN